MKNRAWTGLGIVAVCGTLALLTPRATAQTPPSYGFDFVTIGDPGNFAYSGGMYGQTAGRGSVAYEYRIARHEVTTSQWMEFVNTFSQRVGGWNFARPHVWGARWDPTYTGPGQRWILKPDPDAGMFPVGGISWHESAQYANWLHNGKSTDPASLDDGAYDSSTWGVDPVTGYSTDGPRLPGAKYWIPTIDEWLKAAHYDPNKFGTGLGGYWLYPHSSDSLIRPGPPGVGQTSAGWQDPLVFSGEWNIPLGAYPLWTSPWGLLDVSGGAAEWMESWWHPLMPQERIRDGASAGFRDWQFPDRADVVFGGGRPNHAIPDIGLRIASRVPSPGAGVFLGSALYLLVRSRGRF